MYLINRSFLLSTVILVNHLCAQPQTEPESLTDYDIIQFITTAGPSPRSIIEMDNNNILLLACIDGRSEKQLAELNIRYTQSQLRLLQDWRLLKNKNGVYFTDLTILGLKQTEELRRFTQSVSADFGQLVTDDITDLNNELKKLNRDRNAYSILFSYIIDGLVWDYFRKNGLLEERVITAENPFWSGVIWAVYPPRKFSCGTNSITDRGYIYKVNWSEQAIKKMIPFVADWDNQQKMFEEFIDKGRVEDTGVIKVFAPFYLFDHSGRFTVPVIEETEKNALYAISLRIASKLVAQVPEFIDTNFLLKAFQFRNKEEALVVAYHELMWDLLDYFEAEQLIQKPIAFADPDRTQPSDISDLIFFVIQSSESTN